MTSNIKWCPGIGPGGIGRYLIIGGPANGGPLEKENVDEVFSLWSWRGPGGPAPVLVIPNLRPYTVRPEAVTIIQVNGQPRVLFAEDRARAVGYATRNAIHWPVSVLGDPASL